VSFFLIAQKRLVQLYRISPKQRWGFGITWGWENDFAEFLFVSEPFF